MNKKSTISQSGPARRSLSTRPSPALVRLQAIGAAATILFARLVAADDWPYYQHDAGHTGDSNASVNPQALSLAWTAPSSTFGYSTPVIIGNTIYATQPGLSGSLTTVSSFNLSTGALNWSYTGEFVYPSQAGIGGGFVTLVGSTASSSSLYVLDPITGTLRYTVPIPEGPGSLMPTIVQDPISGNVTAFVADGGSTVSAVSLGPVSGSVLWTQYGLFGGQSIPTVVGSSIVLAGPNQYYAFDRMTGAENHFWSGGGFGGGGTTVAYDAARQQFYVLEDYDGTTPTLSAYHYTDNDHIRLLWHRTGAGVGGGGSAAIGPTGKVYSAGNSVIWELNPATGATLRFIPGSFASGVTPALTNNVLWISGEEQVFAYDLVTLQLSRAFNGSRGSLNTPYDGPGAFADGYFVLDYGVNYGSHSFDVYRAPTPSPTPASQLGNISTRAFVQAGDNVMIGGFIVQGAEPKRVIIRAIAPELTQYGVPDPLANPTLELHDSTGALIASNDNWQSTIIGGIITSDQRRDIRNSGHAPGDGRESAIIADLPGGNYTAIVRGVNDTTGVALVEVYDLSPETNSMLANLSTRSFVQTGDNVMIGGFIVQGTAAKSVIVRAIGPELTQYGVPNILFDPTLELHDHAGALIASNDNWQHTIIGGIITMNQVHDIMNSGHAPGDPSESAIIAELPPGNYTAIVRGVNDTTGVGLVEVYDLQ
jgi:hypothetical protein